MALTTGFQSGAYTGTYNSLSLGLIADAWRIRGTMESHAVRADYYGDSVIDLIRRGGNYFCVFEGLNFAAVMAIAGGVSGAGTMGISSIGCFLAAGGLTKALVLTAKNVSGSCAPSPLTLTAPNSTLAEGFDLEYALGNSLRTVPMMLRLLPYESAGEVYWYSTTG